MGITSPYDQRMATTDQAAVVEAAFAELFPVPCACPVHHAVTGTCQNQSVTARISGEGAIPLCSPCAVCWPRVD
jgi:hypothetical protein